MWRSGRVVETGGLEIRQVVHPSDTNQRLRLHSTTSFWGVLGGFGRKMCNRMCNSKNFVQQQEFCATAGRLVLTDCSNRYFQESHNHRARSESGPILAGPLSELRRGARSFGPATV